MEQWELDIKARLEKRSGPWEHPSFIIELKSIRKNKTDWIIRPFSLSYREIFDNLNSNVSE